MLFSKFRLLYACMLGKKKLSATDGDAGLLQQHVSGETGETGKTASCDTGSGSFGRGGRCGGAGSCA